MLSRRVCSSLQKSSSRSFAILVANEEFPNKILTRRQAKPVPVVKESTLPSGVKVITQNADSAVSTVKFTIASGSRAESLSEKGAAQLIAASAFAGTGKRSGLRLVRDLENLGATVRASADREKITYEAQVLSDKAEEAIALVAEAIASPTPASYTISEAKPTAQVVYDKLAADPLAQVSELLHEAAFGEATPLGAPFLASDLSELEVADVINYRNAHFTTGNITVTATNVNHESLEQVLQCYLHGLPTEKTTVPASPYIGGEFKVRAKLGGASYLALGFPLPAADAAKPYRVLFEVVSGKIAALKLPAGSLVPFYSQYSTGGIFGFLVSGNAQQAAGRLEAGVAELKAVAAAAHVDGAKTKVSLEHFVALEGAGAVDALVSNGDVREVSASSVAAAAAAALKAVPSYAVLGTTLGTPSYASIAKLVK